MLLCLSDQETAEFLAHTPYIVSFAVIGIAIGVFGLDLDARLSYEFYRAASTAATPPPTIVGKT